MTTINVTTARNKLYSLINETNLSHQPIQIKGKNGNAVLIAENDWLSIEETLFLKNIPGMSKSIIDGINANLKSCSRTLDW